MTDHHNQREAYARVIDPGSYRGWEALRDYCLKLGDDQEVAERKANLAHGYGIKEALSKADQIIAMQSQGREPEGRHEAAPLDAYDAGLLGFGGGGDVDWWQDYIRAELGRAHDFYVAQHEDAVRELHARVDRLEADQPDRREVEVRREGWKIVPIEPTEEMLEAFLHAETPTGPDRIIAWSVATSMARGNVFKHLDEIFAGAYRAMIAAAPAISQAEEGEA